MTQIGRFRTVSLWDLTGTSAAVLLMCLSGFGVIRQFRIPVSWLRDFAGSFGTFGTLRDLFGCWDGAQVEGVDQFDGLLIHDDVIKWKHFPRYWPFARGFHRSPVKSPHKGQWRGALMFSVISAWINGWVNNREAGDLRRHQVHCDVIVMLYEKRISGRYLCGRFIFMWLRRGTSMACRTVRYVCAIAYLCGLITWDSGWLISVMSIFLVHLQWTRITQEFVKCTMTQMKWIMPNVCDSTYLCRLLSCDSGWMNGEIRCIF